MKKVLNIIEEYLRKYPTPFKITKTGSLLQFSYSYSLPFTDFKSTKTTFLALHNVPANFTIHENRPKLLYDDKGIIQ